MNMAFYLRRNSQHVLMMRTRKGMWNRKRGEREKWKLKEWGDKEKAFSQGEWIKARRR